MNPTLPDLAAALSVTILLRATLVLGATWLATLVLRRASAATRQAVWSAGFVVLVGLPAAGVALPRWTPDPTAAAALPGDPMAPVAPREDELLAAAPSHVEHGVTGVVPGPAPSGAPAPWPLWVPAVWLVAAGLLLLRLVVDWLRVRSLVRGAKTATGAVAHAAELARRALGLRRAVRVVVSERVAMPMCCGVLRPAVLLPAESAGWPAERLRVVLLHELAHVRRGDPLLHLLTGLARAMYWPNPLVHLAARSARAEQERACDDEVLRAGTSSCDYAEHLVAIARNALVSREPAGTLAMAHPATLAGRVQSILAAAADRARVSRRAIWATAAAAVLFGLPLASVRLLGEGHDALLVRAALERLSDADPESRGAAAFELGRLRARSAADVLTARLADPDPGVRGVAAWALGELRDPAGLAPLVQTLKDHDPHVREMAVLALGRLGDRAAVEDLAPLLRDTVAGVRSVMTEALQELGGGQAAQLLSLLARRDPDSHTRHMALWAYREAAGPGALPDLVEILADPDPELRANAARNLAELADARAVPALAARLASDSVPFVRASAAWALGRTGSPSAVQPLAAAARNDRVFNVRVAAVGALGNLDGDEAEAVVRAATRDPVHQVRLTAVEAMRAMGERRRA